MNLLTSIDENSNNINARSYIKNFDEEFKIYTEKLAKINKRARYFNIKLLNIQFLK